MNKALLRLPWPCLHAIKAVYGMRERRMGRYDWDKYPLVI
jgi:hypothetical protein